MKELLINQDKFIEWYFDYDMRKTFFDDHSGFQALKSSGIFSVTAQELLDGCGYLPESVVADGQSPIINEDGEVNMGYYKYFKLVKL